MTILQEGPVLAVVALITLLVPLAFNPERPRPGRWARCGIEVDRANPHCHFAPRGPCFELRSEQAR